MKTITRNIIIASLIAVPLIGFIYHKQYGNVFQDKSEQLFDNSLPGLWNVTTTIKTSNGSEPKRQEIQACINKGLIEASMVKPLQSKLGLEGLDCKSNFKKVSELKGELKGEFNVICSGENPTNKHKLKVESKGVIISDANKSFLDVKNTISTQGGK